MKTNRILAAIIAISWLSAAGNWADARQYWTLDRNSNSISWQPEASQEHYDHIEMSGRQVSAVLRYGVDSEGRFVLNKSMIWPMLRTVPNNTHASLMRRFDWNPLDAVTADGRSLSEHVERLTIDGTLKVHSSISVGRNRSLSLERTYFPSTDMPALLELYTFRNTGTEPVYIEWPAIQDEVTTDPARGTEGSYRIYLTVSEGGAVTLAPGDTCSFAASVSAAGPGEESVCLTAEETLTELDKRMQAVNGWTGNLVLETPDSVINRMFAFSKIRACESIFETEGGPMHGPGGESYYAAIWANDQAEYINPYFPFTGYAYGNASALNSFRHFARFMNDEWKPIPSSIIAEGKDIWNGAGDRGDAAMIAYGAARYALARGDMNEAGELWPLIQWTLEYCRRHLNSEGTVNSDSDELEGRFPAGEANLCTSSLYYDALISAAYLAEELGDRQSSGKYRKQAAAMKKAIENYFGATVEGYETYAYYEGNDILRSWICIPLTVGINTRASGTIDALFSPRLWTENGLLTQAGTTTFWDRSTLYALRGAFMAGATEKALDFLKQYSATRLLGDHVPYAVEAWPEGNQRHLSAESGLYGRIITEGIFGIRPTGLRTFDLTPHLPQEWNEMALRHIRAFEGDFDIEVTRAGAEREGDFIRIVVKDREGIILDRTVRNGSTVSCRTAR